MPRDGRSRKPGSKQLPHFRGNGSDAHDELIAALAGDEASADRYHRRVHAMEERLRYILAGLG